MSDYERITECIFALDTCWPSCLDKGNTWTCRGCKAKRIIDEATSALTTTTSALVDIREELSDTKVELKEARQYIKDCQDKILDLRTKLLAAERDRDDYKLAAAAEAQLYDEAAAKLQELAQDG